jgi:hypothetical protein
VRRLARLLDLPCEGCQIVITEALDGLVVKLPAGTRNMMND